LQQVGQIQFEEPLSTASVVEVNKLHKVLLQAHTTLLLPTVLK
jgi:hypothetical protein